MKQLFFLIFMLLLSVNTYGQATMPADVYRNTNVNYPDIQESNSSFDYKLTREWKKHKTLKKWAWASFGVGVPLMVGGSIGTIACFFDDSSNDQLTGLFAAMACTGGGLTITSIPLFVRSLRYKQQAIACGANVTPNNTDWRKHKLWRGIGCASIGTGLALMTTGLCCGAFSDDVSINKSPRQVVFFIGTGLTAASIPLFIVSNNYRKRASKGTDLTLNASNLVINLPNGSKQLQPAIGVSVHF